MKKILWASRDGISGDSDNVWFWSRKPKFYGNSYQNTGECLCLGCVSQVKAEIFGIELKPGECAKVEISIKKAKP